MTGRTGQQRVSLGIDPIACAGIGICAHVAPRLISMDSWGFPMLARRALSPDETDRARAAVTACPKRALFIRQLPGR